MNLQIRSFLLSKNDKMKIVAVLAVFIFSVAALFAQKKMIPVSQSIITGMALPAGSKKDTRILSVSAAQALLEMENNKVNTTLSEPEVLALPPLLQGGFTNDSLIKNLSVRRCH